MRIRETGFASALIANRDDATQVANLYALFDDAQRDRLAARIAGVLGQAREEVQKRQLEHFFRVDEDYGRRVADKLGVEASEFVQIANA